MRRIILILLILPAFLLIDLDEVTAQSRVRILQADVLEGAGENMRKLIHNVVLETKDFSISCDSAYHYQREERIEAFGNIEIITKDNDIIWADYVRHNLRTEESEFRGRVILKNNATTLFSAKAFFDHKTDIATFPEFIRMEDEDGILIAESGIYYNKADSAIFVGSVQIADSTNYTETETLYSNRKAGYYELHGSVFMQDFERDVVIAGDYAEIDSTGYRKVSGNTIMRRVNENKDDTTYVRAAELHVQELDTTYLFDAFGDVEIWTERYTSLSDTAAYNDATELFFLTGTKPKIWFENLQLSGPNIEIQLSDDNIKTLLSYPFPFAVQQDTITNRQHQITGDTLFVDFVDGNINFLRVMINPKLFYHSKNENDEPDGAIELSTDRYIIMYFEDGEMTRGKAVQQSDGTFHPENQETANRKLDGFIWTPQLQPQKPVHEFRPLLPDIPEERPFSLPPKYLEFLNSVR